MLAPLILTASAIALILWSAILLLPWEPHRTRERLEARPDANADLRDVTVLIPARNEAAVIERTLAALERQGSGLRVVVIDDQSSDDTGEILRRFAAASRALALDVVAGTSLPPGWAGKLWALEQGRAHADRAYTLLLDADIELARGTLQPLLDSARTRNAALTSIMAELRCKTFWERLLAPPFVFFFKLLYPFALINDARSRTAGAAGGCMLVRTPVLNELGGFKAIRGALIDDCTLAAAIKGRGEPIWLGLSRSVRSLRDYEGLGDFWRMVSRSAFTQLKYSTWLLLAVTVLMTAVFVAPFAALAVAAPAAVVVGAGAVLAMCAAYAPIVRFYRLPLVWTVTLPVAAVLFLAMTWSSAWSYWRGRRATWKNRIYEAAD